jgi:pantoate kinase
MVLRGNGFCPGHVTGFFSIHDMGDNILKKGSRGAGVNLSLGVMTMAALEPPDEKHPKDPMELKLNVRGVNDFEVDSNLYLHVMEFILPGSGMGWKVNLRVRLQLPVGQGFGMSGAGALSSAIAAWEAFYSGVPAWDRRLRFKAQQEKYFSMSTGEFKIKPLRKRLLSPMQLYMGTGQEKKINPVKGSGKASGMLEGGGGVKQARRWLEKSQAEEKTEAVTYSDCIAAAHRSDILSKGGLGDVVAQARGGLEMRLAPGIPPFGEVHTIPVGLDDTPSVAFMIVGDSVDTGKILSNHLKKKRINESGENALRNLLDNPSMEVLMNESYQFSSSTHLQSLPVKGALMEVQDIALASQVMLGNSVFAFVGGGLGALQKKKVMDTWKRHGEVQVCEMDLMGARPIN